MITISDHNLHLTQHFTQSSASNIVDIVMKKQSNPIKSTRSPSEEMTPRRSKRAGRPRLDATSNAILSDDRRTQVRRAQRTYRLKKEAVFQNAIARAEQLEARIRAAVEEVVGLCDVATEAQLHLAHPDISSRLNRLHEIIAGGEKPTETGTSASVESSPDSTERQVQIFNAQVESPKEYSLTPRLSTMQYTYAFQELRFARRLQRYSLEHAYRLFADHRSDPREIYRVFRLVPCVKDPTKTQPRFRQLLMGGRTDLLEVPGLPFYSIGGAGTHFPDVDEKGNAIYPANSRIPRRILGMFPKIELGNRESGGALEIYGFGGEWFDSRDVEGYLRLHGVEVNEGLLPRVHIPGEVADREGVRSYVLDVESLFSREFIMIRDFSYAYIVRASLWTRHPRPRTGF